MKSWQLVVVCVLCMSANLRAATLTVSIDGQTTEVPVTEVQKPDRSGSLFFINTEERPFEFETANGRVILGGMLDPDPSIVFGAAVFDFGAPSIFGFTFILPLAPTVSNPSQVFDSFSGSVTNAAGPGVTVTALPPLSGVPVDGDGVTEMQVFTLSDDGGATWKNVGLDQGPSTTFPLGVGGSATYGPFSGGPIATIPGGPWTHMRADVTFSLSGGGDIFTFNGAKKLVPEPGTIAFALLALFTLPLLARRRAG